MLVRAARLLPILLILLPHVVRAAEPVDLELVLAADASGSIDDDEFRLQRAGYAAAITNPEVLNIIKAGFHGKIALAFVEWGAPDSQETIVDWMVIKDEFTAEAFATLLTAAPRKATGWNSISGVIQYAANMIRSNEYEGARRIIDISGDGPQLNGPALPLVRGKAVSWGITINALAIKSPGGGYPGPRGEPLEEHYRNDVIGGRGSFVEVAEDRARFAEAILRKMIQEMAALPAEEPQEGGRPKRPR
ncbi:MAG: DUF1194 domain-containing protein [Alphaproteobacteria bacterium]|nr:DUF1194 domain-containing protein [Alphaproteobacteria bacterium]